MAVFVVINLIVIATNIVSVSPLRVAITHYLTCSLPRILATSTSYSIRID